MAGRQTSLQLNVDATALAQAGNGSVYIKAIIEQEIANFLAGRETGVNTPVNVVIRTKFNPNLYAYWFSSVMQVVNNITLLAVILTGAALIREREQGTVEHLLVMPVVPAEIMLSKIIANGLVILIAAGLSLTFVVEGLLKVPVAGSLTLFLPEPRFTLSRLPRLARKRHKMRRRTANSGRPPFNMISRTGAASSHRSPPSPAAGNG